MVNDPTFILGNGVSIPAIGLGVLPFDDPELTTDAVKAAIGAGYRLIDTAAAYGNERQVGEGIRRSDIDRRDLFITTKLWPSQYGYDTTLRAFDGSLRRLGLDHLDLYLLHWPIPSDFDATIASYKAVKRLFDEQRIRAIGVSNFTADHLRNLIERTDVVPAVNQVELHTTFQQKALRSVHDHLGILTQAWSPIGGSVRRAGAADGRPDPLTAPALVRLADRYARTPAQVVLRWHLQNGVSAIPKSFDPARIAANIDIFDFALSAEDMATVDALDTGVRGGPDPEAVAAATFEVELDG